MIPASKLHDLLIYHPESGVLVWKSRPRDLFNTHRAFVQWNQRYAGKPAGTIKPDSGYIIVSIHKKLERAHRVVWAICNGAWPDTNMDHINGCRADNRIANLRLAAPVDNAKNKRLLPSNKTGFHGVTLTAHGKYRAKGYVHERQFHLGYFEKLDDAVRAKKAFESAHGFHANHGVSA